MVLRAKAAHPLGIGVMFLAMTYPSAHPQGIAAPSSVVVTLEDAIHRAQQNEPAFAGARADQQSAAIDRYITKTALLPSAVYHNQVLYTQPNGKIVQNTQGVDAPSPIFIANNAIHEYTSQASIDETLGLKQIADVRAASAAAARAAAEVEIARRGLVLAVVNLYYSLSNADRKLALLTEALNEAQSFADLTQKREAAREAAHADVVKADLERQQRQRDLSDARVAAEKARLELAVLLFPDPRTAYTTVAITVVDELPTRQEVDSAAAANNPEIGSALAGLRQGDAEVLGAKAAYLPDLVLNFSYGIDAPQFAKYGPDNVRNLGYSISGTLDIPVWDWLSTQKRVKQSEIRRDVARVVLTAAQRRLIANLDEAFAEATAAREQLTLLDQIVQTAAESLRLTRLRYTAGEATVLEVVDAQNAYSAVQAQQADGALRYQNAKAALQILTGSL
jgi:outer membrane protein TolC